MYREYSQDGVVYWREGCDESITILLPQPSCNNTRINWLSFFLEVDTEVIQVFKHFDEVELATVPDLPS